MIKLERLLFLTCVLLLNLCNVTANISDYLHLLKSVESLGCLLTVTNTGNYIFNSVPGSPRNRCGISVKVEEDNIAYVKIATQTCETTISPHIMEICDQPAHETHVTSGTHTYLFDSNEPIAIEITFNRLLKVGCGDWGKNLHDFINTTVIFENDTNNKYCMVQLPPSLHIMWFSFLSKSRRKPCCPDVFVASTDIGQNPMEYSESFSACDLRTTRPSVITRCESTFMYLRQSAKNDQVMFRVQHRPKNSMDKCLPTGIEVEPSDFVCHRRPKISKKTKNPFSL
ncbi:hypothetical protein CAEBREN_05704 [Caenorhabditis brenneri]|uniref:Uncharacterized protein n=1 Tax=Caenorhabditis brenneri TaxID=135651 RepID=G0MHS9_CAEBE|nr:hypothetical protein CAEBREN_05704 [Caenorhabditis brenneri]